MVAPRDSVRGWEISSRRSEAIMLRSVSPEQFATVLDRHDAILREALSDIQRMLLPGGRLLCTDQELALAAFPDRNGALL